MAQIINITSEALQAAIRRLLPSQQGFGEDLQASNVVTPIIDLTPTAEGSATGVSLQEAMSFGGVSSYEQSGTGTTTVINTPGFWRIQIQVGYEFSSVGQFGALNMTDGLTTKVMWKLESDPGAQGVGAPSPAIMTIFVRSGESLNIQGSANAQVNAQTWQIADVNGVLVNPVGFTPQ